MQEIPPFQHIDCRLPRFTRLGSSLECYIPGSGTVKGRSLLIRGRLIPVHDGTKREGRTRERSRSN